MNKAILGVGFEMLNSVASPHQKCRFELDPFVIVIVFVLVIDQSTCVVNEVLILYSTHSTLCWAMWTNPNIL